jgi:hypothetical protein
MPSRSFLESTDTTAREEGLRRRVEVTALMEELLARGAGLRVMVTGDSMRPFLSGGETVTIGKTRFPELRTGDLVLYRNAHGYAILHRIVGRKNAGGGEGGEGALYAMGDAMRSIEGPIPGDAVLGRVTEVQRTLSEGRIKSTDMDSSGMRRINYLFAARSRARARAHGLYRILRERLRPSHPFRARIRSEQTTVLINQGFWTDVT